METAAVLHRDPGLTIEWNQIHLCELNPDGFDGFGREFKAALQEDAPNADTTPDVFADLDRIHIGSLRLAAPNFIARVRYEPLMASLLFIER